MAIYMLLKIHELQIIVNIVNCSKLPDRIDSYFIHIKIIIHLNSIKYSFGPITIKGRN